MRSVELDPTLKYHPELGACIGEYGQAVDAIEGAAERMRRGCGLNRNQYFQACHINPYHFGHFGYMTWLTDQAAEIPFPPTVYHVTGIPGAMNINTGQPLLSSTEHRLGIPTHKGEALYLYPLFLEIFGINTGQLREFLFSGPQVDAEQLDHSLRLPYSDTESYSHDVVELFLTEADHSYVLNPRLLAIIQALQNNLKPEHIPELKKTVDNYLFDLYRLTFIREGWLEDIRDLLYGRKTTIQNPCSMIPEQPINWKSIKEQLLIVLSLMPDRRCHEKLPPVSTKPAVLEIDTQALIKALSPGGLFAFVVSNRPVQSIITSLAITPDSVKAIYVHEDDLGIAGSLNYKVNTFDDIPPAAWLGRVNWRDVKPDMWNPLCSIRYDGVPLNWISLAKRGKIAPLEPIFQSYMRTPRAALAHLFGEDAFGFIQNKLWNTQQVLVRETISYNFPTINGVFNPINRQ